MLAARCTRPLISDASRRLVFLGPPGVGKGTYARCVSMEAKIPTISTGSLIRDEIRSKTALGQKVEALVSKGGLIGGAEVLGLLGNRLKRHNENGFILDGVPRTLEQAQGLPKVTQVDGVVVMTLDEHSLREKLAGRRVCSGCGRNYNVSHIRHHRLDLPPLLPSNPTGNCDDCQGVLVHRDDDREEVVRDRLAVYHRETEPLIDYYTSGAGKYKSDGTPIDVLHFDITGTVDVMMPVMRRFLRLPEKCEKEC